MADYNGRKATVKYGDILLPASNWRYTSTARFIESITTHLYPEYPGSLDHAFDPRKDPLKPDMGDYPLGTPTENAKRIAMHGLVPQQIFGGIRKGTISLDGFYKGKALAPRAGNLANVQLYQPGNTGLVSCDIVVSEVNFDTQVRGWLKWSIKGEIQGQFSLMPS